jgi:hypothetical protein
LVLAAQLVQVVDKVTLLTALSYMLMVVLLVEQVLAQQAVAAAEQLVTVV